MTHKDKPIIGITMGDPAGIGPEIIIKAFERTKLRLGNNLVVYGDAEIIRREASRQCSRFSIKEIDSPQKAGSREDSIEVIGLTRLPDSFPQGAPSASSGDASFIYVRESVLAAIRGDIDAIVTAPISKEALKMAGHDYPGHTEILADFCKTDDYAMMLAGTHLRVVLCTIHVPYSRVPQLLSRDLIIKTIRITHDSLSRWLGTTPRIAVASLNPHAGEGGMFGREEQELILPAVQESIKMGINASGPFPADTLFYRAAKGEYDAVVCMYHDQGLIPLKLLDFESGVNITLGLPIVRTSVDHGTAFDIAGLGEAESTSMEAAIEYAISMSKMRDRG